MKKGEHTLQEQERSVSRRGFLKAGLAGVAAIPVLNTDSTAGRFTGDTGASWHVRAVADDALPR